MFVVSIHIYTKHFMVFFVVEHSLGDYTVLLSMLDALFTTEFVDKTLLTHSVLPNRSSMKNVFAKLMKFSPVKMGEQSVSKVCIFSFGYHGYCFNVLSL